MLTECRERCAEPSSATADDAAFVDDDQEEVELKEGVRLPGEVLRPPLQRLVDNRVRMARGRHRPGRLLDDVLVDAKRFVELTQCLLETPCDRLPIRMIQALVVGPAHAVHDADGTGLRQEGVFVDEAPERQQAVERARLPVVLQNAADRDHRKSHPARSTRWCRTASYRARATPARIKIWSICGSWAAHQSAKPYNTPNNRQPARKL